MVSFRGCWRWLLAVISGVAGGGCWESSTWNIGALSAGIGALSAGIGALSAGKDADFLRGVLVEGGELSTDAVVAVAADRGRGLAELYAPTALGKAAEAGAEALRGGPLTEFEKLCDEAVDGYLAGAQLIPFGEAPLAAYLAARDTEITNLRILLLGRRAGLAPEVIRSRLRRSAG